MGGGGKRKKAEKREREGGQGALPGHGPARWWWLWWWLWWWFGEEGGWAVLPGHNPGQGQAWRQQGGRPAQKCLGKRS